TGLSVGSGATLTFTPANWDTAQQVTVAADPSNVGPATFTATAAGYQHATVSVTETPASSTTSPAAGGGSQLVQGPSGQGQEVRDASRWAVTAPQRAFPRPWPLHTAPPFSKPRSGPAFRGGRDCGLCVPVSPRLVLVSSRQARAMCRRQPTACCRGR